MKIVSKKEAMKILESDPVNLRRFKFCTGKYKWKGSQKAYIGNDVVDISSVKAVYVERRQDADGPYALLMSISER